MNASKVIEKILSDAQADAEKIKKEADEKETSEQAELAEQLDEYEKQTEVLAQKSGEERKMRLLAAARMEIAKDFLGEKRKILDEVFEQAKIQFTNLPDEEYRKVMAQLMKKAAESGDEEVIIDKKEKRINDKLINQVNQQLGNKGNLKLSEEKGNLGAGFILKRGKIKNNVSLQVLLEQARKELEIELAKELFS
ncbi:MAG: V-type ATP synthase subunit E [Sedimentisphaerales bacterium]